MEHRRRIKRERRGEPGLTERASTARVFRWQPADRERDQLSDRRSLAGRAQPASGSDRRDRSADDSQSDQSLLRSTEHRRHAISRKRPRDGGHDGREQHILDSLASGIILLDHNLLIAALNPAAENILGVSERRATGQSLLQLVDDSPELRDVLSRVLDSGDRYAQELKLSPNEANHDERILDCRVAPIDLDDAALLIELTDVTRRTRITRENALLAQHGAGRQMVSQLAHEIKNPLGGIRGAAQLLAKQLDDAELKEYTDVVISETDRLTSLVDTLLGPGGAPNRQPVNIHELIEYVVRITDVEEARAIQYHRDYDPALPIMMLDRDQMVQAFLNLVQNAAVALEGHGTITLRSRAVMNFTIGDVRHSVVAAIEIEDDGPGIPIELQDSVFYPLVTSRAEGTGLGLPVAQELVNRHGGLIEFESRPGRTVFTVLIPLNQESTS